MYESLQRACIIPRPDGESMVFLSQRHRHPQALLSSLRVVELILLARVTELHLII